MSELGAKKGTKIVCFNDLEKPDYIKEEDWIEDGVEYTIAKVNTCKIQNQEVQKWYILEEINSDHPLFLGYDSCRFGFTLEEVEKMVEESGLLNNPNETI